MNLQYQHLIPEDFSNESKVYIYQCSRLLTVSEALQLENLMGNFINNWESHNEKIKAYANLLFGQFVVVIADDKDTSICGRSIDALNRFMKEMEQIFSVQLLDRQSLAFVIKDKIQLLPLSQLKYGIDNNFIEPGTLYFNNAIIDKEALLNNWIIPAKNSWLKAKFQTLEKA
jgi:hypothetical protein